MSDKKLEIVLTAKDITGKAFTALQTRLKTVSQNVLSLQGAFVGLAGAAGIGALVKSSFELNDKLAKTSDRLGLTTEALAGLRHAAELSGAGTDTLDMALQRLTRRVAEAATGSGEAVGALKELGLSAEHLNTLPTDEKFKAIAQAFEGVQDQSDRVRLAFKLFDSEGVKLVNTLNMGAKGLNDAAQEARDLGLAISRVDAAKIEAANDAFLRVQTAIKGVGNTLAIELAPYVEQTATAFSDWAKANNELVGSKISEYVNDIADAAQRLWNMASYDPDILTYGIAGLVLGGKKGAVVLGGMAHMVNWAQNLTRALELSAAGLIEFSDIAKANFQELEALIKPYENARIGEDGTAYYKVPSQAGRGSTGGSSRNWTGTGGFNANIPPSILPTDVIEIQEAGQSLAEFQQLYSDWVDQLDAKTQSVLGASDALHEFFDELDAEAANIGIENELNDWFGDIDVESAKLSDKLQENYKNMVAMSQEVARDMQGAFSDFFFDAMTGQLDSLGDYVQSFIRSIQQSLASALSGKIIGAMFGGPAGAIVGGLFSSFFHGGGVVGVDSSGGRSVPAAVFAGAPRLHSGLMADEYPAILQRGESVLTPGQLEAVANTNRQPVVNKIEIINQTNSPVNATMEQPKFNGEEWVSRMWLRAANDDVNGLGAFVRGRGY